MFSATKFIIFLLCLSRSYGRIAGRGDVKLDPISTSTIESTSTVTTEASTSAETTPEFVTRKRMTMTSLKPKTTTKSGSEDEIIDWMLKTLKTRPTTKTVKTTLTTKTTPTTITTATTPLRTTKRTTPTSVTTPRTIPTVTTPKTSPQTTQTTQVYIPRYRSRTTTPDPFNEIYKDVYPYVWSFDQPKPLPPFYHESIANNHPADQGGIEGEERLNTPEVVITTSRTTPKPFVIYQNERKYWVISNYRNSSKSNYPKSNPVISYRDTMAEQPLYPSRSYGVEPGPSYRQEGWGSDQITMKPIYKTTIKMTTKPFPSTTTTAYSRARLTTVKPSVRSGEYINMATPLYDAYQQAQRPVPIGNVKSDQIIAPSSYPRIQPKIYESDPNPEENSYYQAVHPSMPSMKYYKYGDPAQKSN